MIKKLNNRALGALGEKVSIEYLEKSGFKILEANFRVGKLGEIDIIARHGSCLCFIEVKTRSTNTYGVPSEAVNWKKQNSIRKIASIYLSNKQLYDTEVRFDIIEITGTFYENEFKVEGINLLKNAF